MAVCSCLRHLHLFLLYYVKKKKGWGYNAARGLISRDIAENKIIKTIKNLILFIRILVECFTSLIQLRRHLKTWLAFPKMDIFNRYIDKHLCILVPAPLWHRICINFLQCCRLCSFCCYLDRFDLNLVLFGSDLN